MKKKPARGRYPVKCDAGAVFDHLGDLEKCLNHSAYHPWLNEIRGFERKDGSNPGYITYSIFMKCDYEATSSDIAYKCKTCNKLVADEIKVESGKYICGNCDATMYEKNRGGEQNV